MVSVNEAESLFRENRMFRYDARFGDGDMSFL